MTIQVRKDGRRMDATFTDPTLDHEMTAPLCFHTRRQVDQLRTCLRHFGRCEDQPRRGTSPGLTIRPATIP
jgi:hypothetical protein